MPRRKLPIGRAMKRMISKERPEILDKIRKHPQDLAKSQRDKDKKEKALRAVWMRKKKEEDLADAAAHAEQVRASYRPSRPHKQSTRGKGMLGQYI